METTKLLILFCFLILLIGSCRHTTEGGTKTSGINSNEVVSAKGEPLLIGKTTREALESDPYGEWFSKNYSDYLIDSLTLDSLKPLTKDISVQLFLGTWCEDSHREVPSFFKILDYLKFDERKIKLISVDRDKKSNKGETENMAIEFVPTFIFYRQQKEIGRIVETPSNTLEKDLLALVK